ncbi:MAG: 2-oxoglutarate and iron-dependent oxygenase domain-containing protein [Bacteroidota bacterium]
MDPQVPIIDLAPLIQNTSQKSEVGKALKQACRTHGFFYVVGHGVSEDLQQKLETLSAAFFALPLEEKMQIRMALGGKAWRGYFPVGDELTSGKPDLKEGLYLGRETAADDPRVQAGELLMGPNLFPAALPELGPTILEYMAAVEQVGHHLMRGLALSLDLDENFFQQHYTTDPLTLFRIFHYPPAATSTASYWGVGEHTDYGLLTILKQDQVGGLQINSQGQWIPAPFVPNSFICNIGDMLERMTGGYYVSTPHRVLNASGQGRFSYPFFFDPNLDAQIEPLPLPKQQTSQQTQRVRWDGKNVMAFRGTYRKYLIGKIGQVFPDLMDEVQDQ